MADNGALFLVAGAILLLVLGIAVSRRRAVPPPPLVRAIPRPRGPEAEDVLDHLEEGVVVLNPSLTPVVANTAARRLLGLATGGLPPSLASPDISSLARQAVVERTPAEAVISLHSVDRHLRVRAVPLNEPEGVLVFVRDVTDEQRVLQLRRQFVANASHELKTPVTSLQTLAEAVADAATSDPQAAARFGGRLVEEAQRLGTLIKDLLDLSRVEDPAAMALHDIDLSELIRIQVKAAEEEASTKSLHLDPQIEPGLSVRGDGGQLELMVRNLVDNAIRYTPEGGHVTVELIRDDTDAILEVTDDGIGIPLHAQTRVFERFYRVDEDRARAGGGTGLGLSIVRNATELHGGTVGLTSVLGEGSTFIVRLPLAKDKA